MTLLLKYDGSLDRGAGDKWFGFQATFSYPQVLIQYESELVRETWDYLGRAFCLLQVESYWAVAEWGRIWPNRPTLLSWNLPSANPYRLELRLVRYLQPGRLRVWEVDSTG